MDEKLLKIKRKIRSKLRLKYILPEDLPAMDLYMDQVTHFMDEFLGANRRNEEEKVLTKTMINNYTRNRLMPPPRKKKYSREHLIMLIYIYYLKNVLSIEDIRKLVEPLMEDFPTAEKMAEIYDMIYELEKPEYFNIEASTIRAAALVENKFPEEKDEYLNKLALVYLLSYDIYSKKRLIEKLIDEMSETSAGKNEARKAVKAIEKEKAIEKAKEKARSVEKEKALEKARKARIKEAAARKKRAAGKTAVRRKKPVPATEVKGKESKARVKKPAGIKKTKQE